MAELEALQSVHDEIRALGAQLVAVSPQLPEHSKRMTKRLKLDFPILFDAGNAAAAQIKLTFDFTAELTEIYGGFGLDLPKHHGEGGWTLPMPARFVIDQSGIVRQAAVHPDYKQRPEPQVTLDVLQEIASGNS